MCSHQALFLAWPPLLTKNETKWEWSPVLAVLSFYTKNMLTALTLRTAIKARQIRQSLYSDLIKFARKHDGLVSHFTSSSIFAFLMFCICGNCGNELHEWSLFLSEAETIMLWLQHPQLYFCILLVNHRFYRGAFFHIYCLKQGTLPTCCSMWFCGMLHSDRRRNLRG